MGSGGTGLKILGICERKFHARCRFTASFAVKFVAGGITRHPLLGDNLPIVKF